MPAQRDDADLPAPLKRSPAKAKRTYRETLASAEETYDGDQQAAHRVAYSALKHSFEREGDRWTEKDERGPSDPQAKRRGAAARRSGGETFGGVDVEGHTKAELYERARSLDVKGRSSMSKADLGHAIQRAQQR